MITEPVPKSITKSSSKNQIMLLFIVFSWGCTVGAFQIPSSFYKSRALLAPLKSAILMRQHLVRWRWKCLSTLMPKISLKFECTSLVTYMYNRYTTSHHMELAFSCRVYCTNHRHNRISTLNIMKQYPSRRHVLF